MRTWPMNPVIYEITTWVWLNELSQKYQTPVDLATMPPEEWDRIASLGFDAVWFMGVWERSPAGIAISTGNQGLLQDFKRALPDFAAEDNVGSPYCVRRYENPLTLGATVDRLRPAAMPGCNRCRALSVETADQWATASPARRPAVWTASV
jgi:hypothetical protein